MELCLRKLELSSVKNLCVIYRACAADCMTMEEFSFLDVGNLPGNSTLTSEFSYDCHKQAMVRDQWLKSRISLSKSISPKEIMRP